jgi:hypothetical protein
MAPDGVVMSDGSSRDQMVRYWFGETSAAAAAFERRWTLLALRRVNRELAARLQQQRELFDKMCSAGTAYQIEVQGAALCRGYLVSTKALEAAAEPDDAYMLGLDPTSGLKVAIGHQRAAVERIVEVHGQRTCWVSPDEIAVMMASVEQFKKIAEVKQSFPGAEIMDLRRRDDGATE